ncbi:PAS domain-containing protein [Falsirhodobacter halotolerans]|uniref:PAS domain-containing protein n=1 Tax=Falsirhodobacter halotolerans TaxID=1146892 RepID=UPI001FD5DDE9|nr:PAS domain-containing protein [Falsirhodobacter halotolerans]MCJ8139726.1 PAS domain-containing protein [Falsirhodobacter halotolerans]
MDRFPLISAVHAYWQAQRGADGVAPRDRIDPRSLPTALPNIFLIERIEPGVTRFRVAGGVLSDLMAMDVRGMPFLSLIVPTERAALATRLDDMMDGPGTLDLSLAADSVTARALLLPLRTLHGVDQALGCLEVHGRIPAGPTRLTPIRAIGERIGGYAGPEASPRLRHVAEDPVPFTPAPRPHLRLVHSVDHNQNETPTGKQ